MGSPPAPVMANFYMHHLEQQALSTAPLKPAHWFRFVNNTFVVWPHGRDELKKFQEHLNSILPNIKFTMETEEDNSLPFLDVLVKRTPHSSLGHMSTETHRYRSVLACQLHHSSQKSSVLSTLV
jgi:hypothetical protein